MRLAALRIIPAIAIAGCMPFVPHGPSVEPGFTTGGAVAGGSSFCDTGCAGRSMIPFGAFATHTIGGASALDGQWSVGAYVPLVVAIPLASVDVYYRFPRPSTTHAVGVGANASIFDAMVYAQAGSRIGRHADWYVVSGRAIGGSRSTLPLSTSSNETLFKGPALHYWSLTASIGWRSGRHRTGIIAVMHDGFDDTRGQFRVLHVGATSAFSR